MSFHSFPTKDKVSIILDICSKFKKQNYKIIILAH